MNSKATSRYQYFVLPLAALALSAASTAFGGSSYPPGSYQIDSYHSKVGFEVPHLVVSSVEGRFNEYSGDFILAEKLEDSKVNFEIKAASIDTGIGKRDDHLRGADFFEVSKYPKISFRSKKVTGEPGGFKILGDLTIKGVTKEVALDAKYLGAVKDQAGVLKTAFQANGKINRKDFGLTWNKAIEAGPAVGDEIALSFKLQAAPKQQK